MTTGRQGSTARAPETPRNLLTRAALPSDDTLRLRPWREVDARAIVTACQDRDAQRWLDRLPHPYHEDHARAYIALAERSASEGTALILAVADITGDAPLGATSLTRIDWSAGWAEAGYWTAPEARRRGIATRALRLLSGWAFEHLPLTRIELRIDRDNQRSMNVANRAGYVPIDPSLAHARRADRGADMLYFRCELG